MMLTLVLVSVLSQQHGPKIIEVGQPVPVRAATKVRTQKTATAPAPEACAKAEAVDAKPMPAATTPTASTDATNGSSAANPAADEAKQAAAAKEYELQKQRMIKHAEDSDELWRKSVDALAGQL